jgi:hypothetical protein
MHAKRRAALKKIFCMMMVMFEVERERSVKWVWLVRDHACCMF